MRSRWLLCWLLFVATALSFLDRQVLSVLAPSLTAEFGMSNTAYSRVVFAFQLSYTVMFAVGGRLMDVLGTRVGMALSVAVWSVASAAHALATGPAGLAAARFFLGAGEGSCFPAATKGAVEWFPVEKRVLAIGIANGGSAFGAVIAPPLTAMLAARFGWRGVFIATGVIGMLWVGAWLLAPAVKPVSVPAQPVPVRALLADRRVRWVLLARFLFDPVFYFYMFWIPQYLARERGFSLQEIGAWYWMPFLVLGISNIAAGRVSDSLVHRGWTPRRARTVLLTAAAALTPVSWLASLAPNAAWAIALMSGLMLAHGFWIANFLGLLSDTFPSSAIATVTGLTGTAGGIGGMLSSLAVGPLVDHYSFTPAFAVSGLLYPAALGLLVAGTRRRQQVLALADDATGALEVGAQFTACGIDTVVVFRSDMAVDADAVVIDTETRHVEAAEAAAMVSRLARGSAPYVYKKTDSTLRGPIAAELEALRDARPGTALLYVPAYPRLGRTVRAGQLYVHGEPFGPVPEVRGVTVLDATTDEDLERIADGRPSVAAGPGGFAGIWARRLPVPRRARKTPLPRGACLALNGSLHPASLSEMQEAHQLGGEVRLVNGWAAVTTRPGVDLPDAAARLACIAAPMIRDGRVANVIVFGGDTVIALLRELGVDTVKPHGELFPGIPASTFAYHGRPIGLITKAGAFGGPGTLAAIRRALEQNP